MAGYTKPQSDNFKDPNKITVFCACALAPSWALFKRPKVRRCCCVCCLLLLSSCCLVGAHAFSFSTSSSWMTKVAILLGWNLFLVTEESERNAELFGSIENESEIDKSDHTNTNANGAARSEPWIEINKNGRHAQRKKAALDDEGVDLCSLFEWRAQRIITTQAAGNRSKNHLFWLQGGALNCGVVCMVKEGAAHKTREEHRRFKWALSKDWNWMWISKIQLRLRCSCGIWQQLRRRIALRAGQRLFLLRYAWHCRLSSCQEEARTLRCGCYASWSEQWVSNF